eukprot:21297_1
MSAVPGRPTAIVTGASSGIGKGVAINLIQNEWNVCMIARSFDKMKQIVADLGYQDQVQRIKIIRCDVSDSSQIISACDEIKKWSNDYVNLLLNNAGGVSKAGSRLESLTIKDWDLDIAINLRAPFIFTQQLVSCLSNASQSVCHYKKNVYDGSIVNISSVASLDHSSYLFDTAYAVAKAGLNHLTKLNATELGPSKVRVNSLTLGVVETNALLAAGMSEEESKKTFKSWTKGHVIGRIGTIDDVVQMIHFLSNKKQSGWVTGGNIPLNGGYHLHRTLANMSKL